MNITLTIEGMSCRHCAETVEKTLSTIPGVTDVKVELASKSATVSIAEDISHDVLVNTVADIGFDVTEIM